MPQQTQLPVAVEIVLDRMTLYDKVNDVISDIVFVYDVVRNRYMEKMRSIMPDGTVNYTVLYPKGNIMGLEGVLTAENPQAEFNVRVSETETVKLFSALDPKDPDLFHMRLGDKLVGIGHRLSKDNPGVAVIFAYGAVATAWGTLGLGAYGIHEGYDIDIHMDIDEFEFGIKIEKHTESDSG